MNPDRPHALSIRGLIDQRADKLPETVFISDPVTANDCRYGQLRVVCACLCELIEAAGVPAGASVAYAMHNGMEAAVTILALQYGGYRAVSVNLVAGSGIMGYVLSHSETELVITQADVRAQIDEALGSDEFCASQRKRPMIATLSCQPDTSSGNLAFEWQRIVDDNAAPSACSSRKSGDVQTRPDAVSFTTNASGITTRDHGVKAETDGLLMYTSGTTGRPKGVVLSQANLLAGGMNVADGHKLSSDDKALCVLPLFHINGLCVTLLGPLVSAGSVVMPPRFSTSKFWTWIEQYDVSWFSVVPTQISYLLRDADQTDAKTRHRPRLRFGRSASAPLSPDVHGSFETRFNVPLIETMGLTETAAQILSNPMPPGRRKLGSPGLPVGVELRIVDSDLQDAAAGEEGELLIRGRSVMQRYFKNPESTESALVQNGWLRTGDLGRCDEDGFVFITGRLKELIIKGGENIAPREIDDALYRHPDVVEAAAFAVSCSDYGQRVEAAVCLKPGSTVAAGELLGQVRSVVGQFKCPDQIHLLDELPKGPSGKIQRNKLCDMRFG